MNYIKRRWLVRLQDIIGPSHLWPRQIRRMIFEKTHINNKERFTFMVFAMNNGFNPALVIEFFEQAYSFDSAAWRQINWVIKNYPVKRWKSWNVIMQRTV